MKVLANILIGIAVVSIILGIIIRLDILTTVSVFSCRYPLHSLSFLRFANSMLLLAIALLLAQIVKTK